MSNESYCPGNNNYGRDKKLPMSNEKNKAEGLEEAANKLSDKYANSFANESEEINSVIFQSCKFGVLEGAHWQRNDPAFIAEIVEKTLAYVAEKHRMVGGDLDTYHLSNLHPDIVNQILKEKV